MKRPCTISSSTMKMFVCVTADAPPIDTVDRPRARRPLQHEYPAASTGGLGTQGIGVKPVTIPTNKLGSVPSDFYVDLVGELLTHAVVAGCWLLALVAEYCKDGLAW